MVARSGRAQRRLSARYKTQIQAFGGPGYQFDEPAGIAYDGQDLWIANSLGDSVTEVSPGS